MSLSEKMFARKNGDKKMLFYIICYAFLILIGISLFCLGGKGIYIFIKLENAGISPVKMLDYADELVDSYAFACGFENIDCNDLDYSVIMSTKHGGCIKLKPKGFSISEIFLFLRRIPSSEKIINVIKPIITPMGRIMALPMKIEITDNPIEKILWPNNELRIEDISKIREKKPEKSSTFIFDANLEIGNGKTPTYFVANEIGILKHDLKIDVQPEAYFLIGDEGMVVYEDRLLVKGSNHIEHWKYPDVDSFLLILPKKNIPKEKYNKIIRLREKMIEFKELLEKYKGYCVIGDTSKMVTLEAKLAGLLKDIQKLAEDLDVGYMQEKMESEYKEACK